MAYFAQLDENNVVTNVIVVKDTDCQDSGGSHSESVGIAFCRSLLGSNTNWVESREDGSIRNRPAGIGHTYDSANDRFIAPQPYPSWTMNQSGEWEPPTAKPSSDGSSIYLWNEDTLSWDEHS